MPPTAAAPESDEPEETLVANSKDLLALREESGQHAMVKQPDLMALDDDLPADLAASPPSHLLDAIGEEVAGATFSDPPGAKPIAPTEKKAREPLQAAVTRFVRKPRTLYLLLFLLFAVAEYYFVVWTERRTEELQEARARLAGPVPPAGTATQIASAAPAVEPKAAEPAIAEGAPEGKVPEGTNEAKPVAPTPVAPIVAAAPTPVVPTPVVPTPAGVAPVPAPEPAAKAAPAVAPDVDEEPVAAGGAEGFVKAGSKLLAAGDAKGARDEFARAVAADAKNAHAREGLGEALMVLGEHSDALVQIEEAIRLRPRRVRYRVLQGDALQALGKPSLAKDAWNKALEIDPSDRGAQKRLNL